MGKASTNADPSNGTPAGNGGASTQRNPPGPMSSDGTSAPTSGSPGASDGSPGGPLGRPFPTFAADSAKRPLPASPISKLLGNKDFIVTIDCHGDYVTVSPGSLTYRWTASSLQSTDQALVQSVANLIARRQASVRPGEPPYRPIIRFQVSSEGLRTYYHVYPLLEPMRVPMTRENVAE